MARQAVAGFVVMLALVGGPLDAAARPVAADTLSGRVVDSTGAPVAGATVLVVDIERTVTTDREGRFVIPGVANGRHTVLVRRVGYASALQDVTVSGVTALSVTLVASVFELDAITVTASRSPVAPRAAPLPSDAIGSEQLRREHSVSLAHTLEQLPGVHTLSTGMQIGKPVIRGLTGSRVRVLESGMPLQDLPWSDEDAPSVDARLADRVEVIRGPASLLYGSDAIGGVVNVIPAALPQAIGGARTVHGSVEAYGASNNGELGGALEAAGANGPLAWRLATVARFSEELHTPVGPLDNTGFSSLSGEAAVGLNGSWGSGTLRYARYGGEFKLLEANPPAGSGTGEAGGPERKLSDDRIQLGAALPLGAVQVESKLQLQRHWLSELGDVTDTVTGTTTEGTEFAFLLNSLVFDVLARRTAGRNFAATLGGTLTYEHDDSRGPDYIVPDARTMGGGAYLLGRWHGGRVDLFTGARFDARRLEADANASLGSAATTLHWNSASADAGIALAVIPELTLSVNAGLGWRAPNLFELFVDGPRIGDALYEIGSASLAVERAFDLDVGLRWQTGRFHGEVSAYRDLVYDYIYLAPTGATQAGLDVYEHRQADAELIGGEAGMAVEVAPPVTLNARFDAVRATNTEASAPLPLTPPPSATFGAELHSSTLGWADEAGLEVETAVVTRQTRLAPYDIPTDGYALINVGARVSRTMAGRQWRLLIRVRNAANTSYTDFLSRYKAFALNPGRNIVMRLSTDF